MSATAKPSAKVKALETTLREHALGYPETVEDFPWGHRAIKVRGKAFVFLAADGGELSMSVKLPRSGFQALALPFTEPTGYGLGKSGWVTARIAPGDRALVEQCRSWIDESYRAIAPKRVVAALADNYGDRA